MALDREEILIGSGVIGVRWRRNARARRLILRIDPRTMDVIVTLPARSSKAAGLAFVQAHAAWIIEKRDATTIPSVAPDASIMIGGLPHRIRHMPLSRRGAWIEGGELMVSGEAGFLLRRVRDFLRAEAKRRIGPMALDKARAAQLQPSRMVFKDTSSRWGSCSSQRVLMFSWRLIMAPSFVQDYVTAHEVAHLRHMNHGPQFWSLVRSLTPHTDAATGWLKRHGPDLMRALADQPS